jgi:NAD(P)-dependent dehydrogenase (short-subunit alcohol dehydrogenase family)
MFHKMTPQMWSEVINTNLTGLFNMTNPVWGGMRERKFGRVINISSINGQKGQAGQVNYSAAKAGDIGFTRALAQEGARAGITVNADLPWLYRHRHGPRHRREGAQRAHHAADSGGPSWRARGNRALRGVPGIRRCRLHHRFDDLGQWRPVFLLIAPAIQDLKRLLRGPFFLRLSEAMFQPTPSPKVNSGAVEGAHGAVSRKNISGSKR